MKKTLLSLALWILAFPASAQDSGPLGRWITASGNLEIDVAPCGEALCGTVVKVLANRSMSAKGEEMASADPRDPLGMQILRGFAPDGPGRWEGEIYDREKARSYSCIMSVSPAGELALHAYVGIPWFGRTQTWRRAGL